MNILLSTSLINKEAAIQEESCMTAVWDLCVNVPVQEQNYYDE